MNISLPAGFILGSVIIAWSIATGIANPQIFLNTHALAVVIGGTLAAALICVPFSTIISIARVVFKATFGQSQREAILTIREVVSLSEITNNDLPITDRIPGIKNIFLRECLLLADEGTISDEELESVLYKRVEIQNDKYNQEGMIFKIIGKFPPAFGLIGTSLGMIALLQSLGGEGAFQTLGPTMSVALTATFWGLVVANLFLIPMGENLALASQNDLILRRIVVEGVMLIKEKKHPIIVEEYLKSYLAPSERNKISKTK